MPEDEVQSDLVPIERKKGGRPKGSKNKPKGILPPEVANEMLLKMKSMLPEEHFEYMKSVIKDGKAVSLRHEVDALLLILSRNLLPALVAESGPIQDEPPELRRDVTERLKAITSLMNLRHQIEKTSAQDDNQSNPILTVLAKRGVDPGRYRVLIGVESGDMVRVSDGTQRSADSIRSLSDTVPERQESQSDSHQESSDWILDHNQWRDGSDSSDTGELSG